MRSIFFASYQDRNKPFGTCSTADDMREASRAKNYKAMAIREKSVRVQRARYQSLPSEYTDLQAIIAEREL
uniref:Uncharacterized protein n=1 Tax=Pararge aegeria TaxID=116150 RepID=S4NRR5_9NEOP